MLEVEAGQKWVKKTPRAKYDSLVIYKDASKEMKDKKSWYIVPDGDTKKLVIIKEETILEQYKKWKKQR